MLCIPYGRRVIAENVKSCFEAETLWSTDLGCDVMNLDVLSLLSGLLILLARIRAEDRLTISSATCIPAIRRLLVFPVVLPVLSLHIYIEFGFPTQFFSININ